MTSRSLASTALPNSTVAALSRAGYDTLQDLLDISAQDLAEQTRFSLLASQAILENASSAIRPSQPLSQSVANLVSSRQKRASSIPPVDNLLAGGLSPGQIIEISGPPGSPKETALLGFVAEAVRGGSGVLFVDCQNMHSPSLLVRSLSSSDYVLYTKVQDEVQLMSFLHQLPSLISSRQIQMVVFSHLSFTLQKLPNSAKTHILEAIRQSLLKLCASAQITIVISSQLSTKLYNLDGSAGNFDTGTRASLAPAVGANYLPKGRSYRLMVIPLGKTSGYLTLLSSPVNATIQEGEMREPYTLENGILK